MPSYYTAFLSILFASLLSGCGEVLTKEITVEVPNLINPTLTQDKPPVVSVEEKPKP